MMKIGDVVLYVDRDGDVNNALVAGVRHIEGEEHARASLIFLDEDQAHTFGGGDYFQCIQRVVDAEYGEGTLHWLPRHDVAPPEKALVAEEAKAADPLQDALAQASKNLEETL